MYFDEPYPPENRTSGDFFGRQLPPLPAKRVCPPEKYYSVNSSFVISRSKPSHTPPETLKVTIIDATDVGWCKLSQSVRSRIDDGPQHWVGKVVFLKFFDPLYINPDDLQTLYEKPDISTPPGSSSSDDSLDGTTLAGSVELQRKKFIEIEERSMWSFEALSSSLNSDFTDVQPLTSLPVENRSQLSTRCFENNLRAYTQLFGEDKNVAEYLGHFSTLADDRELEEDRKYNVLMLEVVSGRVLETFPLENIPSTEKRRMRKKLLAIMKLTYENKIYLPIVSLRNFLLSKDDYSPRMIGFSVSFHPAVYSLTEDECKKYADSDYRRLEHLLKSRGYDEK